MRPQRGGMGLLQRVRQEAEQRPLAEEAEEEAVEVESRQRVADAVVEEGSSSRVKGREECLLQRLLPLICRL